MERSRDSLCDKWAERIDPRRLSVAVPCYNEQDCLRETYARIRRACEACTKTFEIIFVNDGSKDATWKIIRQLCEEDPHVVGINLSRNHGHQLALTAGLRFCRGGRILVIDADLQDPPELLAEMMKRMDEGADVVYGKRASRKSESLFKRATAYVFYRMLNYMSDINIPTDTGDFRLMSRKALDVLNSMPEYYRYIRGMVSWLGFKQVPIEYHREERFAGKSKYPLLSMLRFAANAMTSFSIRPLRLAAYLGLVTSLFLVLAIAYVILSYFTLKTVQGWASLMVVVLFLACIQLFSLGIIGEYLGRMFIAQKQRPLFIIDEIVQGGVESSLEAQQRTAASEVA